MATEEIRYLDKIVFGSDATRCAITGRIFETGRGSPPREIQTARFIEEMPPDSPVPWKAALETLKAAEAEGFRP